MEKAKESYKSAEIRLILFEFSDIVTASGGTLVDDDPSDWGDWS